MIKVGITGGIGTGKSIVSKIFNTFGIPTLDMDSLAKNLMNTETSLIESLKNHFGKDIYQDNKIDRKKLASIVFNDKKQLEALNKIVHPITIQYSIDWMNAQKSPYAIKEAAIMIESNSYKDLDFIIGIDAPLDLRIQRVIKRDVTNEEEVLARINKQMDNTEKMSYCDFVILNDDKLSLLEQSFHIHQKILNQISNE